MAGTRAKMKEEEEKTTRQKLANFINTILAQAAETRKGFRPEVVAEFEKVGKEAQENKKVRETTPSKYLGNLVVTKKKETTEPVMTAQVSRSAIEAAMDLRVILDEQIVRMGQGKKLTRKEW